MWVKGVGLIVCVVCEARWGAIMGGSGRAGVRVRVGVLKCRWVNVLEERGSIVWEG